MESKATINYHQNSLQVSGELNFTTVVSLWKNSLPKLESYSVLNFDLGKVSVSNSAGIALILEWIKYAKLQGKTIQFTNIPPHLSSILAVAGVSSLLNGVC